jgi:hypothetical protein
MREDNFNERSYNEAFDALADIQAESDEVAKRLSSTLAIYRDNHPALSGFVQLLDEIFPAAYISSGRLSVAITSAQFLTQDPKLSMFDHAALSNLLEIVVECGELFSRQYELVGLMEYIYQSHNPIELGVEDD